MFVMRIEWLGGHLRMPSPDEGMYLKAFDPDANDGRGHLVTTNSKRAARQFATSVEAFEFFTQQSTVHPFRLSDGKPNRPLTAYTVSIERVQ